MSETIPLFHFVYKTTNNINGKFYVGKHSTRNLDDGYMGGGNYLHNSFKKHGLCNFSREYISFHDTEEEAYAAEAAIVTPEFVARKDTYNLWPGGQGFPTGEHNPNYKRQWTDEERQALSEKKKGVPRDPDAVRRAAESLRGHKHPPEFGQAISERVSGEGNPRYGHRYTDEEKAALSLFKKGDKNPMYGLKGPDHPAHGYKWTEERKVVHKEYLKDNHPMRGKEHSEEYKRQMSESRSGDKNPNYGKPRQRRVCEVCGKDVDVGNYGRYHGEKCGTRIKKECPYCYKMLDSANYARYHGDRCKLKDWDALESR